MSQKVCTYLATSNQTKCCLKLLRTLLRNTHSLDEMVLLMSLHELVCLFVSFMILHEMFFLFHSISTPELTVLWQHKPLPFYLNHFIPLADPPLPLQNHPPVRPLLSGLGTELCVDVPY